MKKENVLSIICFAGFLFFLLNSFFGVAGVLARRELEKYIPLMQKNIDNLLRQNRRIVKEISSFKNNPQRLELEARRFSYFPKNTQVIEFKNYKEEDEFTEGKLVLRSLLKEDKKSLISYFKLSDFLYSLVGILTSTLVVLFLFFNIDIKMLIEKYKKKQKLKEKKSFSMDKFGKTKEADEEKLILSDDYESDFIISKFKRRTFDINSNEKETAVLEDDD